MRVYFAVVGATLLLAALWLLLRRVGLLLWGACTMGRIDSYTRSTIDDSEYFLPCVRFVDMHGKSHTFTATAGHPSKTQPEGAMVRVRYRRDDPTQACIDSPLHMWGAVVGCAVLGIAGIAALWVD